jgi:hypothetical protein
MNSKLPPHTKFRAGFVSLGNGCGRFWLACGGFGFWGIGLRGVFLSRAFGPLGFRSLFFAAGRFLGIIGYVPSFAFVNDSCSAGNDSFQSFLAAKRAFHKRGIAHALECFGFAMAMRAAVFVSRHFLGRMNDK